ncbi:MAG: F0F1 ATP synthase subunit A [bacterium]|nr:F0F1 ATP synthase subunit A [bacterium]
MSPHIEVAAETIGTIFGFPITNTLIMVWITIVVLAVFSCVIYRGMSIVPGRLQNIFEILIERFLGMMEGVFGTRDKAEKYFPVIATIFLLVLLSNWMGILPGVGSIGLSVIGGEELHGEERFVPLFRSTASDLNFTLALAIISVFLTNIFGIAAIGFFKHVSKFISIKSPIDFFVGVLELISEIAKMISFSFRLFGNIFAGEVLLVIMAFLAPFLVPVPFLGLELFVGFVQALVFAMLTMVFISISVSHQH